MEISSAVFKEIFEKDAVIQQVIAATPTFKQTTWGEDVYLALCDCIISQQISVKAATSIFNRFSALFSDNYPHANELVQKTEEELRSAGLSFQKIGYLRNLATFQLEHQLTHEALDKLSDEEIITLISQVKGIGRWTVQMILMFSLNRPDVFPIDDLVIKQKIVKAYQLTEEGKALRLKMNEIAQNWVPYRSHVCFYLWRWGGEF
ncbi:MAG: DNA-3-methyladenine glycosylase family protein [Bacteroidia bacterium]